MLFKKGILNLIFYSFLLYYIEAYKQGVNLIYNIFSKKRVSPRRGNYMVDANENEDSDVKLERENVLNKTLDIQVNKQNFVLFVVKIYF